MQYVRNAWYVVEWSETICVGEPFAISILGEPIVIYRMPDGTLSALENRCAHRLAPLSRGRCEGEHLRCMYHGMLFASDGKAVEIPGQDRIPPAARVRCYPIAERHSWIWIWMGEPTAANPDLIPEAVGLEDPDWILGHGHMEYDAEAQLIHDNLLDFSHLSYVHEKSFQPGTSFAFEQADITPLENGIRYQRWIENARGPVGRQSDTPTDNFTTYDFLIPGVLLMWTGSFPVGTAKRFNRKKPDYELATSGVTFTNQAVIPVANRKAKYLFSWGPHRDHGDAELRDMLVDLAFMAFTEDKEMIEAQQRIIDQTADVRIMPTAHERAITLYSRLVRRLIEQENA